MADKVKTDVDTPADYGPFSGPGDALKMPTKSYEQPPKGKHTSIDSPCKDKGGYNE